MLAPPILHYSAFRFIVLSIFFSFGGLSLSGCNNADDCGDGKIQAIEECDDEGQSSQCNANCTLSKCGDGIPNTSSGEECDEGRPTDTCSADCKSLRCDGRPEFTDKVGNSCTDASECPQPGTPTCLTEYYPLANIMDPDADEELKATYSGIGFVFEGGYCSTQENCQTDSDCGNGGSCFWPLENVSQETIDSLAALNLPFDVNQFKETSLCLSACETDCDCREGYICDVPIGDLLAVVEGASTNTFCISPTEEE